MTRVALKFCGGCDPAYDRPVYWDRIQAAAKDRIEWVTLDEAGYEAVLIVNNCDTACLSGELESGELKIEESARVVTVNDDSRDPALVVRDILALGA